MFPRHLITAGLLVLSAVATVSAADENRAATVGERLFAYLDKNSDKQLDSVEFGKIPVSIKTWLLEHGFQQDKAISRSTFTAITGRMLTDLRKGRSSVGVKPAPRDAGTKKTAGGAKPASGDTSLETTGDDTNAEEAKISEATGRLPAKFQGGDADGDGQVDFFEWRLWKRSEMARFYELDLNKDSVLSLAELTFAETGSYTTASASTTSSKTGTKESSNTTPADGQTFRSGTSATVADIKEKFKYIDEQGNGNGKLDPDEWAISTTIKPRFVKAGIDVTKPMSEAEFVAHYQVAFREKEDRKAEKRKRKDEKRERKFEDRDRGPEKQDRTRDSGRRSRRFGRRR